MKIIRYIWANILSLIGNIGLFIFLLSLFGNSYIQNKTWLYIEQNCGIWAFSIIVSIIMLIIEILINIFFDNKFTLNISYKNINTEIIYEAIFCLGIISSIIYMTLFIWFLSKL